MNLKNGKDIKANIKTLPPKLPFWRFKDIIQEIEGCLREKSYYPKKYGHYINYHELKKL